MKISLVLMALALSANTYASGFYLSPSQQLTLSPMTTSFSLADASQSTNHKAAAELLKDAQEYRMSGEVSVALANQIAGIQKTHDVSEEDAVDLLIGLANDILNK